jgi:chitodextrinase
MRRFVKLLGIAAGAVVTATVLAAALPAQAATLFFDDFADGVADGWTTTNGRWAVAAEDGGLVFQQNDAAADARAITNLTGHGTSLMTIVTARVKPRSSTGSVAVLWQVLDANNYAFVALHAGRVEVGRRQNGTDTVLASAAYAPSVGTWQTVTIGDTGSQTQAIVAGTGPGVQVIAPIPPVSGSDPHKNLGVATIGALASFDNVQLVDDVPPIDTIPPSAPGQPVASNITANGFTLRWPASTDNVGVVRYDLTTVPPSPTTPIRIWRTATNSITITDLPARSTNTIEVRAFDAAGNRSAASPQVTVTTLAPDDPIAPTAPAQLVASGITATTVTLTWAASTDNVGVTAYFVRSPAGNVGYASTTGATTVTVTGLAPGTTYTFAVVARDAAGNTSPNSPVVTVTTAASSSCRVNYRVVNTWAGGFQADVSITNGGATTVNGWTLQWTFLNGESIASLWNATMVSVNGASVTVRDAGWNATIAPAASVTFGFTGNGSPVPPSFALNGGACA